MDAGLKLRCMESVVGAKLRPRAWYNSLAYNDIPLNKCLFYNDIFKIFCIFQYSYGFRSTSHPPGQITPNPRNQCIHLISLLKCRNLFYVHGIHAVKSITSALKFCISFLLNLKWNAVNEKIDNFLLEWIVFGRSGNSPELVLIPLMNISAIYELTRQEILLPCMK